VLPLAGLNMLCIGAAAFASTRLLDWPFSFGVPLFGQTLFFMAHSALLARRSALYADQLGPGLAARAAIAHTERARVRLLAIDLAGGALALLLGLGLLIASSPNTPAERPGLLAGSCVMLALGCGLLAHSATLAARRSAFEYVSRFGTPATARLLAWRAAGGTRRRADYSAARRYQLDLDVLPAGGAPYRITIEQLIQLHPRSMPPAGSLLDALYLPEQPEVVVVRLSPGVGPRPA
jgi:hypothetical protein